MTRTCVRCPTDPRSDAGNGMWALEEDAYNPQHFQEMIVEWMAARKRLGVAESGQ